MLFLCFILFVSIQNPKPQVSVFLQTTPPTESQSLTWDFMQSFYFLETDQYGSDIFGSIDNVRILFYFIFIFELNSRAFQLEIKW